MRICAAVAAAALVVLVTGCGVGEPGSDEVGWGLPVLHDGEHVAGAVTPVDGAFRVEENGCFTLEMPDGSRRWVVWPRDAEQADDTVVLPDGGVVADGDRVSGTGVVAGAEVLPTWSTVDSYFRSIGDFCGAGEAGVVVLSEVRS